MDANELRALADKLHQAAALKRDYSMVPEARAWADDLDSAAAYLRAQADAQPVPAVPAGWKVVPVEPTQAMNNAGLSAVNQYGKRSVWETYAAMLAAAPAVPEVEERGPWFAERESQHIWIESDDLTHDVRLYVNGDFESHDQRFAYAQEIARRLNAAPAAPQAEPIDPHMIVAEDRFPDVQAEPKREPVGTLTIRDDMGAEITFHRSFTMRPSQTFAIYPNWDLLTHDIPTRGAFVVNAPKEIGNEFLPFRPAPAAPDGWKLVPVEPTREMIDAAAHHHEGEAYLPFSLYTAMLAAAPAAPQAEPKREPLSDERIAEIQRAAYERAAQECIETAAELRRCADGCTDGRYDWKADGADDCADAIRALGRQQ